MKQKLKKRIQNKPAAVSAFVALFSICVAFVNFIQEDSLFEIVFRQAKSELYTQMLSTAAPSLFYEKKEKNLLNDILQQVYHVIPVYRYVSFFE